MFVKRGLSVRITATSAYTQGELCVIVGSFGSENRLYKNGKLLGADSGNLVTTQPAESFVGAELGGPTATFNDGVILLHAALNVQLSTEEIAELDTPAAVWGAFFAPRRILVPQAAISGLPTLGTVSAAAITSSGFRPSVTYTY